MLSTKPVNSLKRLFAGYHQPLPLTQRQSQEILSGLKLSFRNQLEEEYGRGPEDAASTSATMTAPTEDASPHVRQSAAQHHLKSILSNPLFSHNNETITGSISQQTRPRNDPMEVFDHAVARGMMTIKAATGCLIAKRKEVGSMGTIRGLTSLGAASRVVRWLRTSGLDNELEFLGHHAFVDALVPFLLAEGLDEVAWGWVHRCVTDLNLEWVTKQRTIRAARILSMMVHIKSQPQYGDLNAAITTILDAEKMFEHSPLLSSLLAKPWRAVSWFSTVQNSHKIAPTEQLFNTHIATAGIIDQPLRIEKAHLHLCHPTYPDPTPAVQLFLEKDSIQKLSKVTGHTDVKALMHKRMTSISWLAYLGYDTVQHLRDTGRTRDADDVTEILRQNLASLFTPEEPIMHPS